MKAISAWTSVSVSFSPNVGISPLMPFLMREEIRESDFVTSCRSGPSSPRASLHVAVSAIQLVQFVAPACLRAGRWEHRPGRGWRLVRLRWPNDSAGGESHADGHQARDDC